jgi:uncharacterized protein
MIYGGSHEPEIGVIIDGLPLGVSFDMDVLQSFMDRRAPGNSPFATPRQEPDTVIPQDGLEINGRTATVVDRTIKLIIENTNTRSQDYKNLRDIPRPGHADYTAFVKYGRELEKKHDKIFNFTLTTNGVLIDDDVIDFTNREMGNVVLSMDGRRETHDRMRHSKSGGGTYDSIMDNFRALVDSRTEEGAERRSKEYYMRGTYTAYNKDFSRDVIAMADLGFRETSIEPVVSDPDVPYALHEEDLPQLFEEYEKLALEMLEREKRGEGFNFYHYTVDLTGGPCIYKRVSGCGVSTEYLAVTPTGDLYPCHQFVGDDEMIVGNIYEGITHPETVDIFRGNNNLYTRDECRNCWAKLYCAGGCAANNYHSNGDINKVYKFGCELQRKRIECAMMLAVARREEL